MITLKEWMEVVEYRITEGSTYQWGCFGHNAYSLDSWNSDIDGHSFTIIFDNKTQEVYEVQAHDFAHERAYRLINPDYAEQYRTEAKTRDVLADQAWDDVDYVDLEVDDDWIQKALAIVAGEDYDTRVQIPVDFTDEDLLAYMKLAHERDITFNQLVEQALREAIDEFKRDPESMKQRAERFLNEKGFL
jgi:hypothetical protein